MTKYRKRKFISGEYMHVYQRTVNGFNIFYEREDFLLFYTIFSIVAKQYALKVVELCLMIDHVHILLLSDSLEVISAFIRHYTSLFVKEYNVGVGRHGPLFHKSFGSAPKKGSKKIRSAIVYIGNNPVEKSLCREAKEYRWNFLAYLLDRHPFSVQKPLSSCSERLRKAVHEVRRCHDVDHYLSYAQLRRLMNNLNNDEKEMLTDYIINIYWPFDNELLLSFYGSADEMLHAMRSTSGADYDIREKYYSGSDAIYHDMLNVASDQCGIVPARMITQLSDEQKMEVASILKKYTQSSHIQISKFLHMKIVRAV